LEQICAIINYPKLEWTINSFIEQIYLVLISVLQNDGITRKYESRARWLIRRINVWKPPPVFIIYRKDFPKNIWVEIVTLQKESSKALACVIKRAIEMIFDCIDEGEEPIFNREYYLLSAKRKKLLRWRFDKKEDQESDSDSKYNLNYLLFDSKGVIVGRILDKDNQKQPNKNGELIINDC
jgi:hypothetical protein